MRSRGGSLDSNMLFTRIVTLRVTYLINILSTECNLVFSGLLWPRPTGETDLGNFLSKINMDSIDIQIETPGKTDDLMQAAAAVWME